MNKRNKCDLDSHYSGYCALWLQTCKHPELEKMIGKKGLNESRS